MLGDIVRLGLGAGNLSAYTSIWLHAMNKKLKAEGNNDSYLTEF